MAGDNVVTLCGGCIRLDVRARIRMSLRVSPATVTAAALVVTSLSRVDRAGRGGVLSVQGCAPGS